MKVVVLRKKGKVKRVRIEIANITLKLPPECLRGNVLYNPVTRMSIPLSLVPVERLERR